MVFTVQNKLQGNHLVFNESLEYYIELLKIMYTIFQFDGDSYNVLKKVMAIIQL